MTTAREKGDAWVVRGVDGLEWGRYCYECMALGVVARINADKSACVAANAPYRVEKEPAP